MARPAICEAINRESAGVEDEWTGRAGRQASRAALDLWNAVVDRDGMKGAGYLQTFGHKLLLVLESCRSGKRGARPTGWLGSRMIRSM
jgi:hypothetical protein